MLCPPSAPISEAIRPWGAGALDVGDRGREGEVAGIPARPSRGRASICSSVAATAASPWRVAGTKTDQNCAPTPPARRRGRSVCVGCPAVAMSSRFQS